MRQLSSSFLVYGLFASIFVALTAFSLNLQEEYGKASYYADSLQGRKTASGEPYDKNDFTCSHKTYPFGTKLRVTRLDNNLSVLVRVNDRGPFHEGYVVDVSRAAAEAIKLTTDGVARVKVELDQPAPAPAPVAAPKTISSKETGKVAIPTGKSAEKAPEKTADKTPQKPSERPATYSTESKKPVLTKKVEPAKNESHDSELFQTSVKKAEKKGFGVQVTTLYDADNLVPTLAKLEKAWPGKTMVSAETNSNVTTYRVIVGPYNDRKSAEAQQKQAARKGYSGCFVVDLTEL